MDANNQQQNGVLGSRPLYNSAAGPQQNLGMGATGAMKSDWNQYFDSAQPGSSVNWGGGTLSMGDNGEAKYSSDSALNGGVSINRNSIDNPNSLQSLMSQAPGIAQQWGSQYGVSAGNNSSDQSYWGNQLAQQNRTAPANVQGNNSAASGGQSQGQPQGGYQAGGYTKSPYIDQMAAGITSQMNDNWQRNQLPSIRSGAMSAGGFGGSRQGVVESNGLNDMNRSLGQNLTNLYASDYNTSQDRANSYDLGLRSNDLGFANLDANINNSNFSNQLASANFGMGAYNTMNNQTQAGIQAGTNVQNTPLDYQKYFTGSANNIGSGLASSTSSQTNSGNPYMGAIGGAMLGNQFQNAYTGAK